MPESWLSQNDVEFETGPEGTSWVFCHRVVPVREAHGVALERVATLYEFRYFAYEGIFRCRRCGQLYLHDWQEINNWDSSGNDHPMKYDNWYPISPEEAEELCRDRTFKPSPRLYLRFGL